MNNATTIETVRRILAFSLGIIIAFLAGRARADERARPWLRADAGPSPLSVRVAGVWVEAESRHVRALPLTVRTGFIPLPSLATINSNIRRFAGPTGAEASGLLTGMAYGASMSAELPGRFGDVSVAAAHPSAFASDNRGALMTARMWLSPFAPLAKRESPPLRLLAGAEDAQHGAPLAARRYVVGAVYDHRFFTVGGDRVQARGDEAQARTVGAFLTIKPSSMLDGYIRYDVADRNLLDRVRLITAGVSLRNLVLGRSLSAVDLHASVHRVQGAPVSPTPDAMTTQSIARVQLSVRF